jgi:hypothetical protein
MVAASSNENRPIEIKIKFSFADFEYKTLFKESLSELRAPLFTIFPGGEIQKS